jgi:hypothetical protein
MVMNGEYVGIWKEAAIVNDLKVKRLSKTP